MYKCGILVFGGSGQLIGGPGKPLVERDNAFAPFAPDPPRPVPAVPSIFEWQRAHAAR